jgi:hypothetical protein
MQDDYLMGSDGLIPSRGAPCQYLIREWTLLTQLHHVSPRTGPPTEAVNRRIDLRIDQLLLTDRYRQKQVSTKPVAPTTGNNTDSATLLSLLLGRAVIAPSQLQRSPPKR